MTQDRKIKILARLTEMTAELSGYDDDDLMMYYDSEGYYLSLNYADDFIDNEVDYYVDDMSDDDS